MVMAMVCAMNAGMIGVSHAPNGPANSTMPSTAAHDNANPKLRDMCGLTMSMPNVVQLRVDRACVLRPRNRKPAPPKPINRARDTESEGNTHIASMMYDMPMAMAVAVPDARRVAAAVGEVGAPVVLKILSADIPHKTEAGGVALGKWTYGNSGRHEKNLSLKR